MPLGLVISLMCHAALIGWAYLSMRAVSELPNENTPIISAEVITPSEFLRLKQGSEDAKHLETKANDEPKPDISKNDAKKPNNAPPPPPPPAEEVAKAEEPPPPEPDPIAKKLDEPPPPPPPGPTPEEQKLLQQKLEEDRLKAEADAKKKADEEAKKKAEEEAKKKAAEEAKKKAEAKKKRAEELKKKKLAEAKKKAEEAKKFDPNKIANLLNKAPDDSQKALIDKDPTKKGQQASGTSKTATAIGKEAGTATGKDTVLSAREQDLLAGMIKSRLAQCWRLPGAGGGDEVPVVELSWRLKPDGTLDGDPSVRSAPSGVSGQVAAETAVRAVKACQPYLLPPDKYEAWKDIIWVFDPREML